MNNNYTLPTADEARTLVKRHKTQEENHLEEISLKIMYACVQGRHSTEYTNDSVHLINHLSKILDDYWYSTNIYYNYPYTGTNTLSTSWEELNYD